MTREEAIAEAARLAREHPDRATHSWLPREIAPGQWGVAKVGVPGRGPVVNVQEAKPRRPLPARRHCDRRRPRARPARAACAPARARAGVVGPRTRWLAGHAARSRA